MDITAISFPSLEVKNGAVFSTTSVTRMVRYWVSVKSPSVTDISTEYRLSPLESAGFSKSGRLANWRSCVSWFTKNCAWSSPPDTRNCKLSPSGSVASILVTDFCASERMITAVFPPPFEVILGAELIKISGVARSCSIAPMSGLELAGDGRGSPYRSMDGASVGLASPMAGEYSDREKSPASGEVNFGSSSRLPVPQVICPSPSMVVRPPTTKEFSMVRLPLPSLKPVGLLATIEFSNLWEVPLKSSPGTELWGWLPFCEIVEKDTRSSELFRVEIAY